MMLARTPRYAALVVITGVLALAATRAAPTLAYTTQSPRWEAPGRGPHHQFTKPYKPLRQPPENMPARQHRTQHDGKVMTSILAFAPLGIALVVSFAEWLAGFASSVFSMRHSRSSLRDTLASLTRMR